MRAPELLRSMLVGGALLAVVAAAGVALVSWTWERTAPQIRDNERRVLVRRLHEIVPPQAHDNDLLDDAIVVPGHELLGTTTPITVYRAYRSGAPVAALFTSVAPDGYSGNIYLLIGVMADGKIAGVRVLSHKETPGLGDPIEIERSDWITKFAGRSLGDPGIEQWEVKHYGGVFDQFTGATITPRAVVRAVKNTLLYFERHRDEIFSQP